MTESRELPKILRGVLRYMFICHTFICWILNFKAYLAPRVLVREPWHTLIRLFWATLTSCKPLRQQDQTSQSHRKSTLNIHWKDWWWSWSSSTLTTWCEELTHWKRPWCWERLRPGGEGDDRGWGVWLGSRTRWMEFEQALGDGEGRGSLVCCHPGGVKESDTT